jgi:hypothetical protein
MDTPAWLQDPSASPAGAGHKSGPTTTQEARESEDEAVRAVPRMILYTRVINLVLSVCMIIVSLLAILTTQSATTGVLACYLVVFSCLLCCFETHLKQVFIN